ncbi:outer membrane beta-barrel protein [Tenacibaculum sp. MEBiC06402]|uniref:outer membrane beta-barrel protein n=1 Tax=unclassified Tenacibaculum TaxID=2635139 RepID=UPI003B9DA117
MKIVQFIVFVLICFNVTYAQTIRGKVVDSNKEPISFANVVAHKSADDKIIGGIVTEEDGTFSLEVNALEDFYITISFLGFEKRTISKKTLDSRPNLGDIVLKELSNKLDEVVVEARKRLITRKSDRLVFNVSQSLSSTGGDMLDALRVTPGIKVQNDELFMIGKDNLRILVNGRILQIPQQEVSNYLSSISADDIKSIEVITNPPAKYEAEGNSGLINIIYKKGRKNSWISRIRGVYTQATYGRGSMSGNFNYQKNDFSLSSNLYYTNGSKLITDTNQFYFQNETWDGVYPRRYFSEPSLSARLSMDYDITDSFLIGAQYLATYGRFRTLNPNDRVNVLDSQTRDLLRIIRTNSNNLEETPSHSLNVHTEFKLDSISKVEVNLDYFNYTNNQDRTYTTFSEENGSVTPGSLDIGNNIGDQDIDNYSIRLDIESPLKWASLSYGGKLSFTETNNAIAFFDLTNGNPVQDTNRSDKFTYKENTQALYFSLEKMLSEQWIFKGGLRFENTITEGNSETLNEVNINDYMRLFPTVNINYIAGQNNIFSLDYNKRITRPSFEFLNPFENVQNPFTIVRGNPFLQPSFSDNLSLTHIHKQKLVSSLYFSKVSDGFQQLAQVDPNTNIQEISPLNYYETTKIGLTESYTFTKWKWWESVNILDIHYSDATSLVDFTNPGEKGWNTYVATNNSFVLNSKKTVMASANFWYAFPGVYDIYRTSSTSNLDLSLKFFFLNKDLQLGLNAYDVFRGQRVRVEGITNDVNVAFRNYFDTQSFRVSLLYKFGNKKIRVKRKKFGNQDEKNRTKD